MKPYSEQYYISQLEKFNSKIKTFSQNENGVYVCNNNDNSIKLNNLTLTYNESIFTRLDGYMYKDLREWKNFPVLSEGKRTWMSVTPMEIDSHWVPIKLAKGRVCIAGLGLGYYLQNIIDKPDVTEIVVYEINQDVIDLYIKNFGNHDKVTIINDNILKLENEKFDFMYVDIYPILFDEESILHMEILRENNNITTYFFWGMEGYLISVFEKFGATIFKKCLSNFELKNAFLNFIDAFEQSEYYLRSEYYFTDDETEKFVEAITKKYNK